MASEGLEAWELLLMATQPQTQETGWEGTAFHIPIRHKATVSACPIPPCHRSVLIFFLVISSLGLIAPTDYTSGTSTVTVSAFAWHLDSAESVHGLHVLVPAGATAYTGSWSLWGSNAAPVSGNTNHNRDFDYDDDDEDHDYDLAAQVSDNRHRNPELGYGYDDDDDDHDHDLAAPVSGNTHHNRDFDYDDDDEDHDYDLAAQVSGNTYPSPDPSLWEQVRILPPSVAIPDCPPSPPIPHSFPPPLTPHSSPRHSFLPSQLFTTSGTLSEGFNRFRLTRKSAPYLFFALVRGEALYRQTARTARTYFLPASN